jgi:hypothetical protein
MSEPRSYPKQTRQPDELKDAPDGSPAWDVFDPVIEAYKKDVDRTLLRENLRLSPQERSQKFVSFMRGIYEMRRAARQ